MTEYIPMMNLGITILVGGVGLISGAFGAGITIGVFKTGLKKFREDFEKSIAENHEEHIEITEKTHKELGEIKLRQARLRGEDNGRPPYFVLRSECNEDRVECALNIKERMVSIADDLQNIKKRDHEKDLNWVEIKYILIQIAAAQKIEIPKTFGG